MLNLKIYIKDTATSCAVSLDLIGRNSQIDFEFISFQQFLILFLYIHVFRQFSEWYQANGIFHMIATNALKKKDEN